MKTRFSESLLKEIAQVSELSSEVRANILDHVCRLDLRLYPFEDIDEVVEKCLAKASLPEEKWKRLGSTIAQLLFMVGASAQEPRVLLSNIAERIKDDHGSEVADVAAGFVGQLLDASNVLLGAKATALFEDNERLLLDSKLVVDVRPIFDPSNAGRIAASALLYKLRLTSRGALGDDLESTIFTLRESDLKELSAVVERALKKAAAIRMAKPFGVDLVESRNDDDSTSR